MRINIESIRKKDAVNSINFDYSVEEPRKSGYAGLLGAKKVDEVRICGEISQKNGLIAIDYKIEALFTAYCARCGNETFKSIELDGEGYIADKSEEEEKGGSSDFYFTETDGILDLDGFIVEFLGVSVPPRYLCSEECKGLCQKCGRDLNEGKCSCLKKEKNPAFEILDKFFDK